MKPWAGGEGVLPCQQQHPATASQAGKIHGGWHLYIVRRFVGVCCDTQGHSGFGFPERDTLPLARVARFTAASSLAFFLCDWQPERLDSQWWASPCNEEVRDNRGRGLKGSRLFFALRSGDSHRVKSARIEITAVLRVPSYAICLLQMRRKGLCT
jgi:hypothetical protein